MKAKDLKIDADDMAKKLEEMKKGWNSDPNLLNYKVGKEDAPAINIIRPVGMFIPTRVHYIQDYVPDGSNIPKVVMCIGRTECPVCLAQKRLKDFADSKDKEMEERIRRLYSTERNYINVIPRWEYEYGELGPRCLVLAFGVTARKSLTTLVADYGNPGTLQNGFDIEFIVGEKSSGYGKDYKFEPHKSKQRSQGKMIETISETPLTKSEMSFDMVDLSKYTERPDNEIIEKLADLFEIEIKPKGKKRSEMKVGDLDDKDEEGSDDEESDSSMMCFADDSMFDLKSNECRECKDFNDCKKKILEKSKSSGKAKSELPKGKSKSSLKK